ncbi:gamma-glutamyl-gamma-aminobutyrate hydrolase family protein [Simiduia curdlanivorans]|uniref:Gamma-glutamyl-gamma-aminobutyrate hydrolase family protein n=1 Tax=Simiduia curdlanivorans TaxID=1492769 RepID=A0ABV8V7G7_9GAMM|nr:gamma-glutamyl-gamma-aminobutyrate hydrolase family protein [Simiduia curdlanivorans]MDN3638562.1 gamma-glutamyl-gamma-aminobutyrate hydrolase family protein [Simiduia curdlanivorans]
MNTEPIHIAVTGPDRGLKLGWWASYCILRGLEAQAHYMSPSNKPPKVPISGVIIGGGSDIQPSHYQGDPIIGYPYDPARDSFELDIIKQALAHKLPILGICRGAQLLNVAKGGNLIADVRPLRQHSSNRNYITPSKLITIATDSRLEKLTQRNKLKVNSLHKQAINRPGKNLTVVARDKDQLVQAVEAKGENDQFVLGVQWHPEYLPYKQSQRHIFRGLCTAAKASQARLFNC